MHGSPKSDSIGVHRYLVRVCLRSVLLVFSLLDVVVVVVVVKEPTYSFIIPSTAAIFLRHAREQHQRERSGRACAFGRDCSPSLSLSLLVSFDSIHCSVTYVRIRSHSLTINQSLTRKKKHRWRIMSFEQLLALCSNGNSCYYCFYSKHI